MGVSLSCPVITVGGTNGKGSTCAVLEAILRCGSYRTGLYTSPHLLRYNERVRIAGMEATDEALCASFAAVEHARGDVPLTYFEFGTLAAFHRFSEEGLDAAILEVGLGGRLDAVNVVDADCAVLTSVGIDHVDYLGPDRESIGREKAGIFRAGRPAVVAEPNPRIQSCRRRATSFSWGRISVFNGRKTSGPTGARAASGRGSRIRHCAVRSSCATPLPRCAPSMRSGCP